MLELARTRIEAPYPVGENLTEPYRTLLVGRQKEGAGKAVRKRKLLYGTIGVNDADFSAVAFREPDLALAIDSHGARLGVRRRQRELLELGGIGIEAPDDIYIAFGDPDFVVMVHGDAGCPGFRQGKGVLDDHPGRWIQNAKVVALGFGEPHPALGIDGNARRPGFFGRNLET